MDLLIKNIQTKEESRFVPQNGDGLAIDITEDDRPLCFKFCRDGVGPAYTTDGLEVIPCTNFPSIASVLKFLSEHFGIRLRYNEGPSSEIRRWFMVRTTAPPAAAFSGGFILHTTKAGYMYPASRLSKHIFELPKRQCVVKPGFFFLKTPMCFFVILRCFSKLHKTYR